MAFGNGMHAYPHRFFAGNETNLIMIKLLMKHYIRFEDSRKKRPESNVAFETQLVPKPGDCLRDMTDEIRVSLTRSSSHDEHTAYS